MLDRSECGHLAGASSSGLRCWQRMCSRHQVRSSQRHLIRATHPDMLICVSISPPKASLGECADSTLALPQALRRHRLRPHRAERSVFESRTKSCIEVLTRRSSWFSAGAGVDAQSDLPFMTDEQIARLPIPQVTSLWTRVTSSNI